MYKVKYYHRDKFIGEESFSTLEKAEDSLLESPYAGRGDYYEIIDRSTDKIIQEFVIPTFEPDQQESTVERTYPEESELEWVDWFTDEL